MDEQFVWIPNCEHYSGYTDRHAVLSKSNIVNYLNILNNMVIKSNDYISKMKKYSRWNLERLIKFNLEQNGNVVKEFPYIMYAIRTSKDSTRWSVGTYSQTLGYFIKYNSEFNKSNYYRSEFEKSGKDISEFYNNLIN